MASDKRYSRTIELNGVADFSNIVNAVKKLRSEVEGKANSTDLLNVDRTITKIQELQIKIQEAQKKGFSSQKETNDFNKMIEQLLKSAGDLQAKFQNIHIKGLDDELNNAIKALKDAEAEYRRIGKEQAAVIKEQLKGVKGGANFAKQIIDAATNAEQLKQTEEAINKVLEERKKVQENNQNIAKGNLDVANNNLAKAQAKRYSMGGMRTSSFTKTGGAAINTEDLDRIRGFYQAAIDGSNKAETATKKFTDALTENGYVVKNNATLQRNLEKAYGDLKVEVDSAVVAQKSAQSAYNAATGEVVKADNEIKTFQSTLKSSETAGSIEKVNAAFNTMGQKVNDVAAAEQKLKNSPAPEGMEELRIATEDSTRAFQQNRQELEQNVQAQLQLDSVSDFLGNTVKRVLSLTSAWQGFKRIVRSTFEDIKNLDKAFGSIAMVTDMTVGDLWQQYGTYAEMANRLGQTTQGVIEASSLYYQQGLETAEVMSLTEETMKLATLAGLDFKEATSQMTAAIRAFKLEMSDGAHVTDVYAELAANAAADVQGISEAMSATASIAHSAGMEFETTSAMLTTMIEATQEAPKNLGTAMKTIIARFTELKENVAGTADSEFDDLDYNKVDKALKSVGVSLKDTSGQFRDLDDVFLELSAKWDTLDRNSQRYIATIAAGSRQQSRFIALMENYDRTMELVDTAYNSAGKSSEQFAKYQDTVEYKLNKLKNAWEQTKTTLLSSDVYKDAIDFVTKLVTKLEGLDFKKLLIVGPVALIAGRQMAKNWVQGFSQGANTVKGVIEKVLSRINKNYKTTVQVEADIKQYEEKVKTLKNKLQDQQIKIEINEQEYNQAKVEIEQLENSEIELTAEQIEHKNKLQELINKYPELAAQGKSAQDLIEKEIEETNAKIDAQKQKLSDKKILSGIGQAAGAALGTAITMGMTGTFNVEEITKMIAAQSAVSAISSLASLNWQAALGQALIGGGSYLYGQWKTYVDSIEEHADVLGNLEKRIDSLKEKQNDLNAALGEATSKFEEQKTRYDTLNDAGETYEKLSQKIILSEEEQEELNSATSILLELEPQLLSYYNEAGQAILNMGDNWDTLMNKEKEYYNQLWTDQQKAKIEEARGNLEIARAESRENEWKITSFEDMAKHSYDDIQIDTSLFGRPITSIKAFYSGDQSELYGDNPAAVLAQLSEERDFDQFGTEDVYNYLEDWMMNDRSFAKYMEFLWEQVYGETKSAEDIIKALNDNEVKIRELQGKAQHFAEHPEEITEIFKEETAKREQEYKALIDENGKDIFLEQIKQIAFNSKDNLTDEEMNFIVSAFSQDEVLIDEIKEKLVSDESLSPEDIFQLIEESPMATFIEEYTILTDAQKKLLNDKIAEIQNRSVSQESEQSYSDVILADWNMPGISAYLQNVSNKASEELKKVREDIGINISQDSDSKLGQALAQASLPNLIAFRDSLDGYSNEQKKIYLDGLEDFYEKTFADVDSPELLNNLVGIKWDDIDILNIEENKKQFTDYAATLGVGIEQAEDIWNSYVDYLTNLGILDLSINAIGLEDYIKEADEKLSTLISKSSTIVEAIQGQIRNGFMSFSETEGLEETLTDLGMDAAKYINYGLDGNITLNTDKLKEDLLTQDDYENEIVDTMREQVNQQIAELENQKAILQGIIDSGKLEGERVTITAQIAENYEAAASALAFMTGGTYESKHKIITISDFDTNKATKAMESIDTQIANLETKYNEISLDNPEIQALISKRNAAYQELYQKIIKGEYDVKDALSDVDQAQADYNEKLEVRNKAEQDYYDKLEDRNKKLKAYTETLYGTELHKNKLDPLNNYSTMLDDITYKANKAKSALDDLEPGDNVSDLLSTYTTEIHNEVVVRGAENEIIEQAMANAEANLAAYSDYWYKIGEEYYIDYDKLNAAAIPDDLSDEIENQIDQLRKYRKQIQDNDNAVEKLRKDFIDSQKKALQSYVNLEKEVVSTLKEKYQEEIDNLKDKYEAMEDADNEYLDSLQDAIDKERKLREKERDWDDLAQKEKKLSLMQRDTSGTNQLEVQKLEQEVQDDREQLLDNAIDDVINGLKELYELQQESRDSEIEYRESLLTEANLIQEANSIIASWQSSADAVNWFMSAKDLNALSAAELEQEKQTWTDLYEAKVLYQEMSQQDFEEFLKASQEEMDRTMNTLTETATTESKRSLDEIKEKILETQQTAYNAWQDAIQNLSDAQEAWDKAEQAAQASYEYWTKLDASVQAAAEERERQKQERIANGTARNDDFDTLQEAKTYFDEHPQNREGYYKNEQGRWVKETAATNVTAANTTPKAAVDYKKHYMNTRDNANISDKSILGNIRLKTYDNFVTEARKTNVNSGRGYDWIDVGNFKSVEGINEDTIRKWGGKFARSYLADQGKEFYRTELVGDLLYLYYKDNYDSFAPVKNWMNKNLGTAYATGGLVNYTGPAWVDGSPSRPEAFLSADDTEMIGSLVDLLQELTFTNRSFSNMQMSTVGDTTIELTVNFDSVSEDYDSDRVIELMQQKIVEAANYTGSNVILRKR